MNSDLIEILADRAMQQCVNERIVNGQRETTWDPKQYNALFATLIIEECIQVARGEMVKDVKQTPKIYGEYLQGSNDGIADVIVAINQHFGVDV